MEEGRVVQQSTVSSEIASAREAQEVQAMVILAKRFPRNQIEAIDRIKNAFQRPALAEVATYEYSRGGAGIEGPSIRAAEAMAQGWGNMIHGVRELEQRDDESTVEAYAWDIETNTRASKVFCVPHFRYSKEKGNTLLTDPRDVYEAVANQGARRVRACILAIIPRDVQDEAMIQAKETLANSVNLSPVRIKALVEAFAEHGVTTEAVEKRIQRRIETMSPAQYLQLVRIGNSIRDGMSKAGDWFPVEPNKNDIAEPKAKKKEEAPPAPPAEPETKGKEADTPPATPEGHTDQPLFTPAAPPASSAKVKFTNILRALNVAKSKEWANVYDGYCNKAGIKRLEQLTEKHYAELLPMVQKVFEGKK